MRSGKNKNQKTHIKAPQVGDSILRPKNLGENHPLGTQKDGPLARQKGPGAVFTILSGYAIWHLQ